MKLKCRICKVEVAQGAPGDDTLKKHLEQHKWQILRLIQGTEGDGTFARFLESMLFEAILAPGEVDWIDHERSLIYLLQGARAPDAVDSDLKGAPRPQKGSGK